MFSFTSKKNFRTCFSTFLCLAISIGIAVCHCPLNFSSEHNHHPIKADNKDPYHEESPDHQHGGTNHENPGHTCLCHGDSISGYLTQGEKVSVKTDFLVASLDQLQNGFLIDESAFKSFRLTHSPPHKNQLVYITNLTFLI